MTRTINITFLFALIFSPMAFGTSEWWSLAIMETLVVAAFLLLLIDLQLQKKEFHKVPGAFPLGLFLAFILLQLVPLPTALVQFISPATQSIYMATSGVIESPAWLPLSLNPMATLSEFFRYASYACFYALTVQLLAQKEFFKKTVLVVVVFGSMLAVLAILQYFSFSLSPENFSWEQHKIFWFRNVPKNSMPVGPYVYHNHYAGLVEMILPAVIAVFLAYKPPACESSFRQKFIAILSQPKANFHILLGFSIIIISASFLMSMSRGGIISLCLSMFCFVSIVFRRNRNVITRNSMRLSLVLLLAVITVGWLGWQPIIERFAILPSTYGSLDIGRPIYWTDSINIIKDFPAMGSGLGTFIDIYPAYRTVQGPLLLDHAHNDYIELLTNGGIIAFILVAWFVISCISSTYKVFLKRSEPYSIYLYVGCLTGIISILFHSVTDFNLQNGANGLYFFFLLGLMVASANTRLRGTTSKTHLKTMPQSLQKYAVSSVALLLIVLLLYNGALTAGRYYYSVISQRYSDPYLPETDLVKIRDAAQKAVRLDRLNPQYHFALANIENRLSNTMEAFGYYAKAVRLNPTNSIYLQALGMFLAENEIHEQAEIMLEAGIHYDSAKPEMYINYVSYLLKVGKSAKAEEYIKKALSLFPRKGKDYVTMMVRSQWTKEEIYRVLPEKMPAYVYFGEYLDGIGQTSMATKVFTEALQFVRNGDDIRLKDILIISRFYESVDRYDDALLAIQQAKYFFPENYQLFYLTGRIYEEMNQSHNAIKEYQKTLFFIPGHKTASRRLLNLLKQEQ